MTDTERARRLVPYQGLYAHLRKRGSYDLGLTHLSFQEIVNVSNGVYFQAMVCAKPLSQISADHLHKIAEMALDWFIHNIAIDRGDATDTVIKMTHPNKEIIWVDTKNWWIFIGEVGGNTESCYYGLTSMPEIIDKLKSWGYAPQKDFDEGICQM